MRIGGGGGVGACITVFLWLLIDESLELLKVVQYSEGIGDGVKDDQVPTIESD